MRAATVLASVVIAFVAPTAIAQQKAFAKYYRVETIPLPKGEKSVDAVAFLPDGRLMCCLSFERIATYQPKTGEWRLFAEGLHQPLGLWPIDDHSVLVSQRPELTLVTDTDRDGRADQYKTVSDEFGLSGNYAEWTFGPVRDAKGNTFFSLGTGSNNGGLQTREVRGTYSEAGHWGRMNSCVPYRGWVMKITKDGETLPFACGFREANGLGFDLGGRLFTIDNQGDFVGTSGLYHVSKGRFYGHPHSLVWREDFDANPFDVPVARLDSLRTRPAVIFPHGDMANSPTQPLCDTTKGGFGPFAGQMFLGEMNSPRILRAMLEEVDGQMQGASAIFLEGESLHMGNNRLAFAPEGKTLYVGQTLYETWAGASGLQRITWTGEVPFEVRTMHLTETGFELTMTKPVARKSAADLATYRLRSYFYNYHEAYGSKKFDVSPVKVEAVAISEDGLRVTLSLPSGALRPGRVYDLRLKQLSAKDGTKISHPWVVYNLNRLRTRSNHAIARVANPKPSRKTPRRPKGGVLSLGAPQIADADARAAIREKNSKGLYVRRVGGGYRVTDAGKLVLVYNRDPISQPKGDHKRGHYIHPLHGLDGERLTDDMPKDHLHHRGVFWAWSQLYVGDLRIGQPWEQKQMSWIVDDVTMSIDEGCAVLRARVLWKSPLLRDKRKRQRTIIEEHATIRVHPIKGDARAIDFEIALRARVADVRIGGSANPKGYGGFSVRTPLPADLHIEGPDGVLAPNWKKPTRATPWVDFSGSFGAGKSPSGIAILCHPSTEGFPQGWTIRRKNSCQNPVFPGQAPVAVSQDKPLVLRYRLVVHRAGFELQRMRRFFTDYSGREK